MNMSFVLIGLCAAWVAGTFYYFSTRKSKLRPMIIGTGSVKSDDEVLVKARSIVVNVVFEQRDILDPGLPGVMADFVCNYKDLIGGKYMFQDSGTSGGYKSVEEESKSFQADDEPEVIYAAGPKKGGDDDGDGDEKDEEIADAPDIVPNEDDDSDIPEPEDLIDSLTPESILDTKSHNFNI